MKQQAALVKQQAALVKQQAALVLVKPNLQPLDYPAPVVKPIQVVAPQVADAPPQAVPTVDVVPVLQDTCFMAKLFDGKNLRHASQPVRLPNGWIHVCFVAKPPSRVTSECYIPPTHDRTFHSERAALQYVKEQNIVGDKGDVDPKHALQS